MLDTFDTFILYTKAKTIECTTIFYRQKQQPNDNNK